jgi:hypothetical protein
VPPGPGRAPGMGAVVTEGGIGTDRVPAVGGRGRGEPRRCLHHGASGPGFGLPVYDSRAMRSPAWWSTFASVIVKIVLSAGRQAHPVTHRVVGTLIPLAHNR